MPQTNVEILSVSENVSVRSVQRAHYCRSPESLRPINNDIISTGGFLGTLCDVSIVLVLHKPTISAFMQLGQESGH